MAIHPAFGDTSFDVTLAALLDSKRELSRRLLLPNGSSERDLAGLFDATVPA
jgi:hypothetical protein